MVLYVFGAIIIVATLIDRSPLLLLSGLGAMSAVILLVYKDTLLSFVAAATRTLRLQTGILVLPYRNPFIAARSIASLASSGGAARWRCCSAPASGWRGCCWSCCAC